MIYANNRQHACTCIVHVISPGTFNYVPFTLFGIFRVFWLSLVGVLLIGIGLGVGVVVFPGVYDPIS